MISGRWIGRGGSIPWPPRSPDLTPLDFFSFWGFIKTDVYERHVENLNRLKCRMLTAVRMVNNMLANTWMKLMSRHQLLRDNGGRHIEVCFLNACVSAQIFPANPIFSVKKVCCTAYKSWMYIDQETTCLKIKDQLPLFLF